VEVQEVQELPEPQQAAVVVQAEVVEHKLLY
jgi:hypothetical protein